MKLLSFGTKNSKKKNKNVLLQRIKDSRHTQNRGNLAITVLDTPVLIIACNTDFLK